MSPRQRGFGFETRPGSDDWWTPRWLFLAMGIRFDLDPCAGAATDVPAREFCDRSLVAGGLDVEWSGRIWLNPPYSNIDEWTERMLQTSLERRGTGITLTYVRSERPWCQDLLKMAHDVLFLGTNPDDGRSRVHFIPGPSNPKRGQRSAPGGPSMMCAFGASEGLALRRMAAAGHGVCR